MLAAVLALLQAAGVKLLEEAGLVLVHLVEGHLEPCGLVAVEVEHQEQISGLVEAAGQTVELVVVASVAAEEEGKVD